MEPNALNAESNSGKGDAREDLSEILRRNLQKMEEKGEGDNRKSRPKPEKKPAPEANEGETGKEPISEDGRTAARATPDKGKGAEAGKQAKAESDDQPFAPKTWTAEERAAFDEAPEHVKQAINKLVKNLQGGFTKKTVKLAEDVRFAEEVRQAVKPQHRQLLQSRNLTEAQALGELLTLYEQVTADRVGFMRAMIQRNGITPEQLGFTAQQRGQQEAPGTPQGTSQAGHPDPEMAALRRQLNALTNVWTQAHNQAQTAAQSRQAAKEAEAAHIVRNFIDEVDETGAPAHPHWGEVEHHVLALLEAPEYRELGGRECLAAAYESAVWANPKTRAESIASERNKATEDAARARSKAAISKKPSGGGASAPRAPETLDEILRRNARKVGAI